MTAELSLIRIAKKELTHSSAYIYPSINRDIIGEVHVLGSGIVISLYEMRSVGKSIRKIARSRDINTIWRFLITAW